MFILFSVWASLKLILKTMRVELSESLNESDYTYLIKKINLPKLESNFPSGGGL